jgi:ATP/maltotriose-dependent transcriptional regulator MalT
MAAAPAADQAMLAADRAFVQAVAQGDVTTAAGLLDQDAAWTAADGATLNALQIRQKMPTPALARETGAETLSYQTGIRPSAATTR